MFCTSLILLASTLPRAFQKHLFIRSCSAYPTCGCSPSFIFKSRDHDEEAKFPEYSSCYAAFVIDLMTSSALLIMARAREGAKKQHEGFGSPSDPHPGSQFYPGLLRMWPPEHFLGQPDLLQPNRASSSKGDSHLQVRPRSHPNLPPPFVSDYREPALRTVSHANSPAQYCPGRDDPAIVFHQQALSLPSSIAGDAASPNQRSMSPASSHELESIQTEKKMRRNGKILARGLPQFEDSKGLQWAVHNPAFETLTLGPVTESSEQWSFPTPQHVQEHAFHASLPNKISAPYVSGSPPGVASGFKQMNFHEVIHEPPKGAMVAGPPIFRAHYKTASTQHKPNRSHEAALAGKFSKSFFKHPIRMIRKGKKIMPTSIPKASPTSPSHFKFPRARILSPGARAYQPAGYQLNPPKKSTGECQQSKQLKKSKSIPLLAAAAKSILTGDSLLFQSFQATRSPALTPTQTNTMNTNDSCISKVTQDASSLHRPAKRVPVPAYDLQEICNVARSAPRRLNRTPSQDRRLPARNAGESRRSRTSSMPHHQRMKGARPLDLLPLPQISSVCVQANPADGAPGIIRPSSLLLLEPQELLRSETCVSANETVDDAVPGIEKEIRYSIKSDLSSPSVHADLESRRYSTISPDEFQDLVIKTPGISSTTSQSIVENNFGSSNFEDSSTPYTNSIKAETSDESREFTDGKARLRSGLRASIVGTRAEQLYRKNTNADGAGHLFSQESLQNISCIPSNSSELAEAADIEVRHSFVGFPDKKTLLMEAENSQEILGEEIDPRKVIHGGNKPVNPKWLVERSREKRESLGYHSLPSISSLKSNHRASHLTKYHSISHLREGFLLNRRASLRLHDFKKLSPSTSTPDFFEAVLQALNTALKSEEDFQREKRHLQAVARRQSQTIEGLLVDKEVLTLEVARLTGLVGLLARDNHELSDRIDKEEASAAISPVPLKNRKGSKQPRGTATRLEVSISHTGSQGPSRAEVPNVRDTGGWSWKNHTDLRRRECIAILRRESGTDSPTSIYPKIFDWDGDEETKEDDWLPSADEKAKSNGVPDFDRQTHLPH